MRQVLGMEGRLMGLAPVWVDPIRGVFEGGLITLGARGDSYYEYLLKQWILSGKTDNVFLRCKDPHSLPIWPGDHKIRLQPLTHFPTLLVSRSFLTKPLVKGQ